MRAFIRNENLEKWLNLSVFMQVLMKSGKSWKDRMEQRAGARSGKQGHQQGLGVLCPSVLHDKDTPCLQVQGTHPLTKELALREVREPFLHLPFLRFLQPEIFNTPRCHVWGQRVLNTIRMLTNHSTNIC